LRRTLVDESRAKLLLARREDRRPACAQIVGDNLDHTTRLIDDCAVRGWAGELEVDLSAQAFRTGWPTNLSLDGSFAEL
jgi:hypothetical protein